MDSTDAFIELVESICKRRSMYVCDGTFVEVCAYLSGYVEAALDCPLSGRGYETFHRYVARHFGFPENYIWPYVLKVCSRNDDEACEELRRLLVQFSNSARTESHEAILGAVQPRVLPQQSGEPENALRKLQSALLTCKREEIEPLILDDADAVELWRAAYAPDVATALGQIQSSFAIGRIAGDEKDGEVKLMTADYPFPIIVKKIGETWKVDAGQIIAIRRYSRELAERYEAELTDDASS